VGVLISKVLLEAQGGKLAIESQKGSGTKVTVTLPVGGAREDQ
jgi:signal transduction histidine kinase